MAATNHKAIMPQLSRRTFLRGAAAASLLAAPGLRGAFAQDAIQANADFDNATLRLDFRTQTVSGKETFKLDRLRFEAMWPEGLDRLAEPLDLGACRLSLYDLSGQTLLFREGFCADDQFSIRVPLPRQRVRAVIEAREASGAKFAKQWSGVIDPAKDPIDRSPRTIPVKVETLLSNGAPQSKTDIVIVGDGYTEADYLKFVHD